MAAITIVGTHTPFQSIIVNSLVREGHQVQGLDSAARGIFAAAAGLPDLVLLDFYAEGIDSYTLLLKLKEEYPDLPVLIYAIKNMESLYRLKQCIQKALGERRSGYRNGGGFRDPQGGPPTSSMRGPTAFKAPGALLEQPA